MRLASCLVDTNILIRSIRRHGVAYPEISTAIDRLLATETVLFYGHQNIAEMWNVMTRPFEKNGLGMSVSHAETEVKAVERVMLLLPESELVYQQWRKLVVTHTIRGVKVHDARLAALMYVHHVRFILTLNESDFSRFPEIEPIHPKMVLQQL